MKFTLNQRLILFTVSLALFMDVLDTNIINTALPAMSSSLGVSAIDLKIALISYLISLAMFIPISGWVADRFGTKFIFISAFALFTISSFFCGYAHTLPELVIARSIQGVGGAFMISLGRLIIARSFQRHELVEAMNIVITVVSLAVMLGPVVGGIITEYWSWQWIFWVNIPIGLLAIGLSFSTLTDTTTRIRNPFDLLGFILFDGSLALLCYVLSSLSESNANIHKILTLGIIAFIMLIVFIIHSQRCTHPVININLFYKRTFRISIIGNLLSRLGFGGMPFLLPLLQQIGFGFNASLSGFLLTPIAFGIVFAKLIAYRWLRRVGYRSYLLINTCVVAITLGLFQLIQAQTPIYLIALMTFIFGIAISAQFTGMNSLAFADIDNQELSACTSITSTTQIVAQSLGVATGAILLRWFSGSAALTPRVFHHTFFVMSIFTLVSCLVFTFLKPIDGQKMLRKTT